MMFIYFDKMCTTVSVITGMHVNKHLCQLIKLDLHSIWTKVSEFIVSSPDCHSFQYYP